MSEQPDRPRFHGATATHAETGRACPYCRFTLKEGAELAVCGACGAPHHSDCWHDNGGCAVFGCAGAPPAGGGATAPLQAKTPPTAIPPGGSVGAGSTGAGFPAPLGAGDPAPLGAGDPAPIGAGSPPVAGTVSPPVAGTVSPPPAGQPPWPGQQPSPGWWANWSLAIAVVILALAVAGAAVAIVLTRQSSGGAHELGGTTTIVTAPSSSATATSPAGTTSNAGRAGGETSTDAQTATVPASEGQLPAVSSEQMQGEIQQMLLAWHEDVVHGEYHAAWELLSRRKQAQDSSEYGYGTWVRNQLTLRPYLNPSGLQVSVESTEPGEGVAQVDVTGMGWDKPGASCTQWSGITWVKYEDGSWKYDPGYSTTPQRERRWKPKFSELLGGQC